MHIQGVIQFLNYIHFHLQLNETLKSKHVLVPYSETVMSTAQRANSKIHGNKDSQGKGQQKASTNTIQRETRKFFVPQL